MTINKSINLALLIILWCIPASSIAEVKKEYYPNGNLKAEKNYKSGKLHGISKWYYESGEIKHIDTYKNGQKITRKAYDERGKLEFDQD